MDTKRALMEGIEPNPGPQTLVVTRRVQNPVDKFISVGSYQHGGKKCHYDGILLSSARIATKFACPACGVILGGPGKQLHPCVVTAAPAGDDLDAMGLHDMKGTIAVLPPVDTPASAPATASPVAAAAPAAQPAAVVAAATPSVAEEVKAKPAVTSTPRPNPRYSDSSARPANSTEKPVTLDSPFVLDGRRLEDEEADEYARSVGGLSGSVETTRFQYDGEQRIVTNRNVTEARQDFVVQRLVICALHPRLAPVLIATFFLWPIVTYGVFDIIHELPHSRLISLSAGGFVTGTVGLTAMRWCRGPISTRLFFCVVLGIVQTVLPSLAFYIALGIKLLPFIPTIAWVFSSNKWGNWNVSVFKHKMKVRWHPYAFAALCAVRYFCPDSAVALICHAANMYYLRPASKDPVYRVIVHLFFPKSERVMWYVPHAGACALAEFSNGTNAEAVVSTCRGKLLRLACLPLPDKMHTALLAGTEEIVKYLVASQPFFEEGATFATVPL